MSPTQSQPIAIPEPSTGQFVGLYTMFYRSTTNNLQSKNFRFNGALKGARERAQRHCDILNYRLHFVQPLICDLKKEEDYFLGIKPAPAPPTAQVEQKETVKK